MADQEAEAIAWQYFRELELPEGEVGRVSVLQVDHDYFDEEAEEVGGSDHVQTYVIFDREWNGFGFVSSRFLIRFGPNDQVQKIDANWPSISFPCCVRARAASDLREELERVIDRDSEEYSYWFYYQPVNDPDGRVYVPALQVREPNTSTGDGMTISGRVHNIILVE